MNRRAVIASALGNFIIRIILSKKPCIYIVVGTPADQYGETEANFDRFICATFGIFEPVWFINGRQSTRNVHVSRNKIVKRA
ncbi:hypothetical protein [Methylobacterium sp. JK268]